jgi:hypothetical protein
MHFVRSVIAGNPLSTLRSFIAVKRVGLRRAGLKRPEGARSIQSHKRCSCIKRGGIKREPLKKDGGRIGTEAVGA